MKRYSIVTGTITYAMRGRDILRKSGYSAAVEKIASPKSDMGCGYAISTTSDVKEVEDILRKNGVKILKITERDY